MDEKLIHARSLDELKQAAMRGAAFYSCENFADIIGRLVVGIGARIEGRALEYLEHKGQSSVLTSPVPVRDNTAFRNVLRRVERRIEKGRASASNKDSGEIRRVLKIIARVSPMGSEFIKRLSPDPADLGHGLKVASYAGRLMSAFNQHREWELKLEGHPYSERAWSEVFLAGVVHDLGRWDGESSEGHAVRGALVLEELTRRSRMKWNLSRIVKQHHYPFSAISGTDWEVHKTLPVVLAEAVVEFPGSRKEAVHDLAAKATTKASHALLVSLCNMERVVPACAVVRVWFGKDKHRSGERSLPTASPELAVCMQGNTDKSNGPYLFRFARRDENGNQVSLLRGRPSCNQALDHMIALRAPQFKGYRCQVVKLLEQEDYERSFGRYEQWLPEFRSCLTHRPVENETNDQHLQSAEKCLLAS